MPVWIVLLRGVNVGGKGKLPMKDFAADLEAVGCVSVTTYIQSGNAVVRSLERSAAKLARTIGDAIESSHGFRPAVMVLSANEFQEAIAANPFPEAAIEPKSLHAYFLSTTPKKVDTEKIERIKAPAERSELIGRVFYLHAPDGIGRSKLAAAVERLLGIDATARNWRTVLTLADMADGA